VIAPCDFLPLLERNGLMGRLGHLMLSDALATLSQWESKGMFVPTVSINMSNTELRNP
jgi:EAL domain-containing protein (putative c-di-GMP-specific phosphodiesterase class I)